MTLRTFIDGTVFAEHVSGRSPRVLALHGWGRDRSDLLGALDGREVIAVDLPGFGSSPPPPSAWGAADYAEAVACMLNELNEGPVLVVGHSFGGRIAAHLAASHGDLVSGVVFSGVPLLRAPSSRKPPMSYRLVRTARRLHLVPEQTLDKMRRRHGSADYNAATGQMREVLVKVVNEDYRNELPRILCPTAFCWGEADSAAPPSIARAAAKLVPNVVALTVLPGVGHDVHRSDPQALSAAVDAVAGAT